MTIFMFPLHYYNTVTIKHNILNFKYELKRNTSKEYKLRSVVYGWGQFQSKNHWPLEF